MDCWRRKEHTVDEAFRASTGILASNLLPFSVDARLLHVLKNDICPSQDGCAGVIGY